MSVSAPALRGDLGLGLRQVLGLDEGQSHPGRACFGLVSRESEM